MNTIITKGLGEGKRLITRGYGGVEQAVGARKKPRLARLIQQEYNINAYSRILQNRHIEADFYGSLLKTNNFNADVFSKISVNKNNKLWMRAGILKEQSKTADIDARIFKKQVKDVGFKAEIDKLNRFKRIFKYITALDN